MPERISTSSAGSAVRNTSTKLDFVADAAQRPTVTAVIVANHATSRQVCLRA